MTTVPTGPDTPVVAPGVRLAAIATIVIGALAIGAAALFSDAAAVRGVAVGVALSLLFFLPGSIAVGAAAAKLPEFAMIAALGVYTLEVVLLAVAFVVLNASGALDSSLDRTWLGVTVIVATLTWTTAQIVGAVRTRVPVYDLSASPGGGDPA